MKLKKAQVVTLSTKEKSGIYLLKDKLYIEEYPVKSVNVGNQHLYFLSDDKIKEGKENVWYYDNNFNKVTKWMGESDTYTSKHFKKIIATTDSSLIGECVEGEIVTNILNGKTYPFTKDLAQEYHIGTLKLPQLPRYFIKYYVEEYNKGNVIEWVDVEYQDKYFKRWELDDGTKGEWEEISFDSFNYKKTNPESLHHRWKGYKYESNPKVDSKNRITISGIKVLEQENSIKCKKCGGNCEPSKALINYHYIDASYERGEIEFQTAFVDCMKCESCGHSFIIEAR